MRKIVSIWTLVCLLSVQTPFVASSKAYAQELVLPKPGAMVPLSQPLNPPILKGIKVHPDNPFRFDFILDKGDVHDVGAGLAPARNGRPQGSPLRDESIKLIKYFLASLTTPEGDLWVNLSPYEKDRIIPTSFGQTEMGRDLLAQDYMLKQITASLIYPEDELGRKFWKRIYEEAQAKYGTTNIPVNTFNKVWIVPDKAVVYENSMKKDLHHDDERHTAYVVESRLRVMLEVDYLAMSKNIVGAGPRPALYGTGSAPRPEAGLEPARTDVNQLGSQIVREIVIPALTREVNEGANFAQLRQVYNSLILATWYKKKIKDSILAKVYADQNKVAGVGFHDLNVQTIYNQYLTAFKKGVFNYIKDEPLSKATTENGVPRKYFSGGFNLAMITPLLTADAAQLPSQIQGGQIVSVRLDQAMKAVGTPKVADPIATQKSTDHVMANNEEPLLHKLKYIATGATGNIYREKPEEIVKVALEETNSKEIDAEIRILKGIEERLGTQALREAGFPEVLGSGTYEGGRRWVRMSTLANSESFGTHQFESINDILHAMMGISRQVKLLGDHGIRHGDIKPLNMVIEPKTAGTSLIDYGEGSVKDGPKKSYIMAFYYPPGEASGLQQDVFAFTMSIAEMLYALRSPYVLKISDDSLRKRAQIDALVRKYLGLVFGDQVNSWDFDQKGEKSDNDPELHDLFFYLTNQYKWGKNDARISPRPTENWPSVQQLQEEMRRDLEEVGDSAQMAINPRVQGFLQQAGLEQISPYLSPRNTYDYPRYYPTPGPREIALIREHVKPIADYVLRVLRNEEDFSATRWQTLLLNYIEQFKLNELYLELTNGGIGTQTIQICIKLLSQSSLVDGQATIDSIAVAKRKVVNNAFLDSLSHYTQGLVREIPGLTFPREQSWIFVKDLLRGLGWGELERFIPPAESPFRLGYTPPPSRTELQAIKEIFDPLILASLEHLRNDSAIDSKSWNLLISKTLDQIVVRHEKIKSYAAQQLMRWIMDRVSRISTHNTRTMMTILGEQMEKDYPESVLGFFMPVLEELIKENATDNDLPFLQGALGRLRSVHEGDTLLFLSQIVVASPASFKKLDFVETRKKLMELLKDPQRSRYVASMYSQIIALNPSQDYSPEIEVLVGVLQKTAQRNSLWSYQGLLHTIFMTSRENGQRVLDSILPSLSEMIHEYKVPHFFGLTDMIKEEAKKRRGVSFKAIYHIVSEEWLLEPNNHSSSDFEDMTMLLKSLLSVVHSESTLHAKRLVDSILQRLTKYKDKYDSEWMGILLLEIALHDLEVDINQPLEALKALYREHFIGDFIAERQWEYLLNALEEVNVLGSRGERQGLLLTPDGAKKLYLGIIQESRYREIIKTGVNTSNDDFVELQEINIAYSAVKAVIVSLRSDEKNDLEIAKDPQYRRAIRAFIQTLDRVRGQTASVPGVQKIERAKALVDASPRLSPHSDEERNKAKIVGDHAMNSVVPLLQAGDMDYHNGSLRIHHETMPLLGGDSLNYVFKYGSTAVRISRSRIADFLFDEIRANLTLVGTSEAGPKLLSAGILENGHAYFQMELIEGYVLGTNGEALRSEELEAFRKLISRMLEKRLLMEDFKLLNFMRGWIGSENGAWVSDGEHVTKQPQATPIQLIELCKARILFYLAQKKIEQRGGWTKENSDQIIELLNSLDDEARMTNEKGGIDFNSDKMNLDVKMGSRLSGADSKEFKFHIDPAQLKQFQDAPGFIPVIINVQPLTDLRLFLGVRKEEEGKKYG